MTTEKAHINTSTKTALGTYYGNHQIGDAFEHNNQQYIIVTPAQNASFTRVVQHQGTPLRAVWLEGYGLDQLTLGLRFDHIVIGIEYDGYAHS